MKKVLINIYLFLKEIGDFIKNDFWAKYFLNTPIILGTDESIEIIKKNRVSMCRYGDGEFSLMKGWNLKFQKYSENLGNELNEIIVQDNSNIIVCIPKVFENLDCYIPRAKKYWKKYLHKKRYSIYKMLDPNKQYYDSLITRFYMDYVDKSTMDYKVKQLRSIWEKKELLIVEGEKSRLGMGNNLFDNATSVERIICPSCDAYEKIDKIEESILKHTEGKEKLLLIALGPTATVLAYRMSKEGRWALDIGHIDIEYEWYLQGVTEKCPVSNKYIGEIPEGDVVTDNTDIIYDSQIIERIF